MGPSDALDVVVTDVLPAEVSYEVDTDSCAGRRAPTRRRAARCSTARSATWAWATASTFDVWARIAPRTNADRDDRRTRRASRARSADPVEDNDCDTADVYVENEADLHVTKYGKPDGQVRAGEILTYTVIVDNLGPSWARDVSAEGHRRVIGRVRAAGRDGRPRHGLHVSAGRWRA